MNVKDSLDSLRDFWKEFSKVKSGLLGLALLLVFIVLGIIGPAVVPFRGAIDKWRDITFWQDNPQAAPPVWANWFSAKKGVVSEVLSGVEKADYENDIRTMSASFDYEYAFDKPPRDLILRFDGTGALNIAVTVKRPDGLEALCFEEQLSFDTMETRRIAISRSTARSVVEFVRGQDEYLAANLNADLVSPMMILFSKLDETLIDVPVPLKGAYTLKVRAILPTPESKLENASLIVSGHVSGILGTDIAKRDIFTGVILGIRWALVIGICTSVITVFVGLIFGVTAAYFGGVVDWLLSRLYELIYLMPVLPFLIVISAIFKPSIWTMIIIICLFFWAGIYKTVYSMSLQIKEETFVEASKALGGGKWRIIFKHIIPILLPYSFAVMALSIPGIIVYEASVSLLGLGDATRVTWGQILNDALDRGAVINQLWWWVVPPGLMIALMGMSFAFLGTALDKILHPKLKTR